MWFDVIKALQRIALSKNDKVNKENKRQKEGHKPKGLWYSFSLGQGWMKRNMYDYGWLGSYKYILYLDTSPLNILQIKNLEDARDFYSKYGFKYGPYSEKIKWDIVSGRYDGIELLNFNTWVKPPYRMRSIDDESIMRLFEAWDMDSGCIWNTQNLKVKKVRPIEERHYKRQHKEQTTWMDE